MAFTINLVLPDVDEKFIVEMSNSTRTSAKGFQGNTPDVTLVINRADLEAVMTGNATFDEQVKAGRAKLDGHPEPLTQLMSVLVQFTPDFEIMPGTKDRES